MIWGEVINAVRKLHLDLIRDFQVPQALCTRDLELPEGILPFPRAIDDFDEWEEEPLPADLQDLLPLHPVERTLIEGPLLPIQRVEFETREEIERLFAAILTLEKSWLSQNRLETVDRIGFIENFCTIQTLKFSVRAGFRMLSALKEKKNELE